MTEQSYLNPTAIREQCALAVRYLEKDNESLCTAENSINCFAQAEELKGAAFEALKQQLADYREAVQAIRSANEADIADFRTLAGAVGEEVLIGENILKQQRAALSARDNYESMARENEQNANTMPDLWMAEHYREQTLQYRFLADFSMQMYEKWKAKEEAYDSIEAATAGLFGTGEGIRTAALHALEAMRGAFAEGTYRPDMGASWRGELEAGYENRVASFSDDGEMTVNWREVEKILAKEAGSITDGEYNALTFAFLNMDGDELGRFLQCLMGERKDVDVPLIHEIFDLSIGYRNWDYSEWKMDAVKVERILSRTALTSEVLLHMQQEAGKEPDSDERCDELKQQRDIVLQRMTLLGVVDEIEKFRGGYKEESPKITVSVGEEGELTLRFCQYREYKSVSFFTAQNLEEATVVVEKTKHDTYVDNDVIDDVEYRFVSRFGSYSIAWEIAEFAEGEAAGVWADGVANALSTYVADELGKKGLGKALGYIPVLGDIAGFAMEAVQGMGQADADAEFIREQFGIIKNAGVYRDFDCCVNLVQYDVEGNDSRVICAYAGERTDAIIEQVNSKFGTSFSRQQLLLCPDEVGAWVNEIGKDDTEAKILGGILR